MEKESANNDIVGKRPIWSKRFKVTLNIIAVLFWLYAILKVFVYDFDLAFAAILPSEFALILRYKGLVFMLVGTIAVVTTKRLDLLGAILYIFLFPLILILWKVPRLIWKNDGWLSIILALNSFVGLVTSFRSRAVLATVLVLSMFAIFLINDKHTLYGCSILMLTALAYAYAVSLIKVFRPSAIFRLYQMTFPVVRKSDFLKIDTDVTLLPVEKLSEHALKVRNSALQNVVLYNRLCVFLAKRLRDYQNSGLSKVASIGGIVNLMILTIVVFSVVNFALYRITPSAFNFGYSKSSLFSFIYYATGSMFYASNGLVPADSSSQAVQLLQFCFSFGLFVIFVTILIATRDERHDREINQIFESADRESRDMAGVLRESFNVSSVEAAIVALQAAKSELVGMIIAITNNLDDGKDGN